MVNKRGRRFGSNGWLFVPCMLFAPHVAVSDGLPPLESEEMPPEIRARWVAPVSPDNQMLGMWIDLGDGGIASGCTQLLCYDASEVDHFGSAVDGCWGEDCGQGSARYHMGAGFVSPAQVGGLGLSTSCLGGRSEKATVTIWHGNIAGSGDLYLIIRTYETYGFCTPPEQPLSAFVAYFPNLPTGHYTISVDLCGTGMYWRLPISAGGAWEVIMADDYADVNGDGTPELLVVGSEPHSMWVWGTKLESPPNPLGEIVFHDESLDLIYDPEMECYDYSFLPFNCPRRLAPMITFHGHASDDAGFAPCGCHACDLNCNGTVNTFDIQPFVQLLSTPPPHNTCSPCAGDTTGDGTINTFDIQGFVECLIQ